MKRGSMLRFFFPKLSIMILKNIPPDVNQAYLLEHHKQTRNHLFAIVGYLHLLKSRPLSDDEDFVGQKEYIQAIEEHCFQLLEHEKKLISIFFLDSYRQTYTPSQLN